MLINAKQLFTGGALPYQKRLEYLESSGSQYIDTGLVLSSDCRVVCDWMPVALVGTSSAYPFGTFGGGKNFGLNISYNGWLFCVWASASNAAGSGSFGTRYTHDLSAAGLYQDGTKIFTPSGTFTGTASAYLFWANGTGQSKPNVRIYSAQFYDGNGDLSGGFIPVLDLEGNPKMFDLVSNSYPTHYGSFVAGPAYSGGGVA